MKRAIGVVRVSLQGLGALALAALLVIATFGQGTPFGNGRGAFRGQVYVPSVFGLTFGDNTSTDVTMTKSAANVVKVTGGTFSVPTLLTTSPCAAVGSAASPSVAACGAAMSGAFSCATNATGATCTVNTTAVTGASQIFVTEDETLGALLGVTCNTSTTVIPTSRLLSARSAATSFTINLGTVTTNPACFSYLLVN